MLIPWPLILKVFSRARLCCGISTQAGIITAFHKALPNWRCSWSVTTQRHAWWIYSSSRLVIFGFFFFLLENLFSRDNQRLGCQVSNLTIFSFSSYYFFFISSECKQSAKIDPSSENLQTGMHYILIPLECWCCVGRYH